MCPGTHRKNLLRCLISPQPCNYFVCLGIDEKGKTPFDISAQLKRALSLVWHGNENGNDKWKGDFLAQGTRMRKHHRQI